MKDGVVLKKSKEGIFQAKHHWIFSGAIQSYPKDFRDGALSAIYSSEEALLGHGYFNRRCSLAGRVVSFGEGDPQESIAQHMRSAISLRQELFNEDQTNAYRLINGEGDLLPGLIVDKYASHLVLQMGTLGMEQLKPWIVKQLEGHFPHHTIYEKSTAPSRKEEGLVSKEGDLLGKTPELVTILENGLQFLVSIPEGQKTGFFLDQRQMRKLVSEHCKDKRVLNCFSYTGGFSLYALEGGAKSVDSVDISKEAIALLNQNVALNKFEGSRSFAEDVFQFLREKPLDYDFIILDPPAFAKKQKDIPNASQGYREINRLALAKMPPGFLLTCSCSYHIDEKLFSTLIFQAAKEAKRDVKIVSHHHQAPDHPVNLFHPEGSYLKSLLLFVQ